MAKLMSFECSVEKLFCQRSERLNTAAFVPDFSAWSAQSLRFATEQIWVTVQT